jgi:sugar/nucleoside kinase (ribokinase family)
VTADGVTTWVAAPRVDAVRNPVGAGDVLTATVAAALETGIDVLTAARRGVAAAAASVERPGPGELDPARMAELLGLAGPSR